MYQNNGRGMAAASLVCGIISCLFAVTGIVGLVCGIVGIAAGSKGKRLLIMMYMPTGMATAGVVLSIIGLCFSVFGCLVCVGYLSTFGCRMCFEMSARNSMNGLLNSWYY